MPSLAKKQQPAEGNVAIEEKSSSGINDENDDEFELTLKRLDERTAKAKVALVKIQKKEAALAQKKREESLAQE